MGVRRVLHLGHQTDPQPRTAGAGLSKTLGAATPALLADIAAARGKPLELWFQDEARIGQKNKITRRWAERGTRPFTLKDQRTASAYIFGAICPALGKAAGLVLPSCNTEAMTLHLQEIALAVEPGAHAVLFP
jgi:DDE superfamily endonuclease